MPRWKFDFVGRKNGALGITYPITAEREGETYDKAMLALFDEYEHISIRKAQLMPDKPTVKS